MIRSLSRSVAAVAAPPAPPGVYQYVVHQAEGSVDAVASAIAAAAPGAGFQTLARVPVGSPAGCGYRAEVVALFHPDYGRQVLAANRRTGPFAVVDRVSVFEDEKGVHVSVTNPRSVAERVRASLEKKGPKWGLHLAYALEIAEAQTVVLGATGTPMDSQSFSIVGAGADSSRGGGKCPGVAHAGAYPIEVVVALDGGASTFASWTACTA